MNIKAITAIALVTAMAAACSEQSDSRNDTTAIPDQQPSQSPMTAPANDPTATPDSRALSQTQPYAGENRPSTAQEPMAGTGDNGPTATEFAAFDADSNGKLGEDEWESNAVPNATNLRNMSFAQIDRDHNGAIDLAEFRQAKTDGGDDTSAGAAQRSLDPTRQ